MVGEEIDLKSPEAGFPVLTTRQRVFSFVGVRSSCSGERGATAERGFTGCCRFVVGGGLTDAVHAGR